MTDVERAGGLSMKRVLVNPPPFERRGRVNRGYNTVPCKRCWSVNTCTESRCSYAGWSYAAICKETARRREKARMIHDAAERFRRCFEAGHDPLECPGHRGEQLFLVL